MGSLSHQRVQVRKPVAEPTPAEIRRECERIRLTWSEDEACRRSTIGIRPPWTVPEVRLSVNQQG